MNKRDIQMIEELTDNFMMYKKVRNVDKMDIEKLSEKFGIKLNKNCQDCYSDALLELGNKLKTEKCTK